MAVEGAFLVAVYHFVAMGSERFKRHRLSERDVRDAPNHDEERGCDLHRRGPCCDLRRAHTCNGHRHNSTELDNVPRFIAAVPHTQRYAFVLSQLFFST